MKTFGLIGYPLGHSFSKHYYDQKIAEEEWEGIQYETFPIPDLKVLPDILSAHPSISGFNVTIPHKIGILSYLDELSAEAEAIGAVNCIRIDEQGKLKGYNTDAYGFEESLRPLLRESHRQSQALVLGNGGAAKAVCYVLHKLQIPVTLVSRNVDELTLKNSLDPERATQATNTSLIDRIIPYAEVNEEVLKSHLIIVNTTPLGMHPQVDRAPQIPYHLINSDHILYDLIYNPAETAFLRRGTERGAVTKNGYEMLLLQAEQNWKIWLNL